MKDSTDQELFQAADAEAWYADWQARQGATGLSVATYHAASTDFLVISVPHRAVSLRRRLRISRVEPVYTMIRRNALLTFEEYDPKRHVEKTYAHDRGKVRHFSRASRNRFFTKMMEINWLDIETPLYFITLTYPREFPTDGAVCRGHLLAWTKKLERKYGHVFFAWKREFQARGAPHYHLMIAVNEPDEASLRESARVLWAPYRVAASGAAEGWTGQGDLETADELQASVQVERVRKPQAAAGYISTYMCKEDQNTVPVKYQVIRDGVIERERDCEYTNVGRWWGFWRTSSVPKRREETDISKKEYDAAIANIKAYWELKRLPEYRWETRIELREYDNDAVDAIERNVREIIAER